MDGNVETMIVDISIMERELVECVEVKTSEVGRI